MKMRVSQLKPEAGLRLIENVNGLTKNPIVPKDTIITNEVIDVLNAFAVKEVEAVKADNSEKLIKKKAKNHQIDPISESKQNDKKLLYFQQHYQEVVKEYKKEFQRWQSGGTVDISIIRRLVIPLFEQLEKEPIHVLFLQNYIENVQDYIYHHAISVGLISGYLAKRLNMNRGECFQVTLAGSLCDCGMARVNPGILNQNIINNDDQREIKLHPIYSYKMLQKIPSLSTSAKLAVLKHHERIDGSGYPLKEKGKNIHLYAKIIAIADVYHALICNRIYKTKVSPFRAIEIMTREMFGKLDVSVLQTLTNCLMPLSINMLIKLSTHQIGKILFIDHRYPTRPVIQLVESNEVIQLNEQNDISIKEILNN
ncbi:metal dependent phosphohydrolase [Caldibacillus thermoamylovorans]|uniref:Metal dependent phosphohydrolase n=1 Tax=Caldibacillus thermoamylovorans TaxID=35841 RepID=A0A090IWK2_9BACI|nr:HD domain-containing phosphohydrolase [Caldibacillus thermoamylovorans]MCM3479004.1 HD domain-containing protein [Caldibacillus thermoamylovorans]CED99885.1 metal dependent phosphohydrolase [Caldibacillus thermoamylovorans]